MTKYPPGPKKVDTKTRRNVRETMNLILSWRKRGIERSSNLDLRERLHTKLPPKWFVVKGVARWGGGLGGG